MRKIIPANSAIGLVLVALLAGCSDKSLGYEQQYERSLAEYQMRKNDEMIELQLQGLLREAARLEAQGQPLPTHIQNAKELAELRRIGKANQLEAERRYGEQLRDVYMREALRIRKDVDQNIYLRSGGHM